MSLLSQAHVGISVSFCIFLERLDWVVWVAFGLHFFLFSFWRGLGVGVDEARAEESRVIRVSSPIDF